MKITQVFRKIFFFWIDVSLQADRIRNKGNSETSVKLGVKGLLLSIFGVLLSIGLIVGGLFCVKDIINPDSFESFFFSFLEILGMILCFASAVATYFSMVAASIVYGSYQLKLNKRPIGYVTLVIGIVLTVVVPAAAVGVSFWIF